jgi:fatty acid-binding protein DegV
LKTESKIAVTLLSLIGLYFIFKPKAKEIPALKITAANKNSIEYLFNNATRRINKQQQDSQEAGKYILVILADNSGSTFTLYEEDKIIHKYPNAFFKTT